MDFQKNFKKLGFHVVEHDIKLNQKKISTSHLTTTELFKLYSNKKPLNIYTNHEARKARWLLEQNSFSK